VSTPDAPAKISSFEDTIRSLGEIVRKLEEGELTLEQSLEAFERGIALARDAKRRLDAAEARVDELLGVDPQGNAVTKPFEARER
jgi:exodeoxyribonuclease VII small subunit